MTFARRCGASRRVTCGSSAATGGHLKARAPGGDTRVDVVGEPFALVAMRGSARSSRVALLRLLLLSLAVTFAAAGRDFYKVLGIDRGADDRTLKKAYRRSR